MKTNELKSIIRGIIQEELKTILPTMIPQIFTEILSNNVKSNIRESSKPELPTESNTVKPLKKYTNNEMLNKILNETVGGIPKEGSFVGYSSPISNLDKVSSFESHQLNESIQEPITPVNSEQSKVMNIMNRDFRSLMKAVDKKKKSGNIGSNLVQSE